MEHLSFSDGYEHAEMSDLETIVVDPRTIGGEKDLQGAYRLLSDLFRPEELEDISVMRRELLSASSPARDRYILTVQKDENIVVTMTYGSVHHGDNEGIAAVRFIASDRAHRGAFANRGAECAFFDEAETWCRAADQPLTAIVCEAVDASEGYVNKQEIEPGNGTRRLYIPFSTQEIHYELPPLAWNADGTPAQEGIEEHLQAAVLGCADRIPLARFEKILRRWWEAWYIRPRAEFADDAAWKRHEDHVWTILEDSILAPIRATGTVSVEPLSYRERRRRSKKEYDGLAVHAFSPFSHVCEEVRKAIARSQEPRRD